jgi:hypothetical protein
LHQRIRKTHIAGDEGNIRRLFHYEDMRIECAESDEGAAKYSAHNQNGKAEILLGFVIALESDAVLTGSRRRIDSE